MKDNVQEIPAYAGTMCSCNDNRPTRSSITTVSYHHPIPVQRILFFDLYESMACDVMYTPYTHRTNMTTRVNGT